MTPEPIVRVPALPQTLLCRCFCRHFVSLTGAGLALSAPHPTETSHGEQTDD